MINTPSLRLHRALYLDPSSTIALIGAGGKTTTLWRLANERRAAGYRAPPNEAQCDLLIAPEDISTLTQACTPGKIICAGYPNQEGKLTGLSPALFARAIAVGLRPIYEADGAACLPVKLHAAHEPALHTHTDQVVLIAGLRALGQPVADVCHRYAILPSLSAHPQRAFNIHDLLETLRRGTAACGLPKEQVRILLNQADTPALLAQGQSVAQTLLAEGVFTIVGSMNNPLWPSPPAHRTAPY